MTSENPAIITEVEEAQNNIHQGDDDTASKHQGKISRSFGNVMRRSKRLMSGKRRSQNTNSIAENQPVIKEEKPAAVNGASDVEKIEVDGKDSADSAAKTPEQDGFEEPSSPRTRKQSQTFYGSEKQVLRDGKKIKEIEVTGEASNEPIDMKKQKKLQRRKSIDKEELNVPCRSLGKADHEGWMYKKAGGHGIIPVSWKKYWVAVKLGKMYCYKTSFNIAADYMLVVGDFTVDNASEKKKSFAFHMKPKDEDRKAATFACETENDCNEWIELLNKILSGIDLTKEEDTLVPDYEDHKRLNLKHKEEAGRKRPTSTAFQATDYEETTGLPSGFGTRTSSTSQPRVRKMSAGTGAPSSVLSVGSMFHPLEENPDDAGTPTNEEDVQLKDLLYKEVEVETEEQIESEEKLVNGNIKKSPAPQPPAPVVAVATIRKEEEENKTASIDAETIIKEMEEKVKIEISEEEAQKSSFVEQTSTEAEKIVVESETPKATEIVIDSPKEISDVITSVNDPEKPAVESVTLPVEAEAVNISTDENLADKHETPAEESRSLPINPETTADIVDVPLVESNAKNVVDAPAFEPVVLAASSIAEVDTPVSHNAAVEAIDVPLVNESEISEVEDAVVTHPEDVTKVDTSSEVESVTQTTELVVLPSSSEVENPEVASETQVLNLETSTTESETLVSEPVATSISSEVSDEVNIPIIVVPETSSAEPSTPTPEPVAAAVVPETSSAEPSTPTPEPVAAAVVSEVPAETNGPVVQSTTSLEEPTPVATQESGTPALSGESEVVTSEETVTVITTESESIEVTATTEVDDLDIPTINDGDSSLMDDITMELAASSSTKDNTAEEKVVTPQENGSVVVA